MPEALSIRLAPDIWGFCQEIAQGFGVSPVVHQNDYMLDFIVRMSADRRAAVQSYFRGGDDAAGRIGEIVINQLAHRSGRILEFAAGYGRVSRHLPNHLTGFEIHCSDIHEQAVALTQHALNLKSFLSTHAPEDLRIPADYDVIFAISFFSHMPPESFGRWLARLCAAIKPGGSLVFTTHGRDAIKRSAAIPSADGTAGPEWLIDVFDSKTFLFDPQSEQQDLDPREYGAMFVTSAFVEKEALASVGACTLSFTERGWENFQDLYVLTLPQAT